MKLLASDYDLTFYTDDINYEKNIEKLKEFRKNNLFVIVTGRTYLDYINVSKNKIDCDYLVVNHGATIIKNGEVIKNTLIDSNDIKKLKKIFNFDNLNYFVGSNKVSKRDINDKEISKIHIELDSEKEAIKAVKYINDHFENLNAYGLIIHKNQIEIVSNLADKVCAIDYIKSIENIDDENIYTVGDGYTDINMLKKYKGYAMDSALDIVKSNAVGVVDSVATLMDNIIKCK